MNLVMGRSDLVIGSKMGQIGKNQQIRCSCQYLAILAAPVQPQRSLQILMHYPTLQSTKVSALQNSMVQLIYFIIYLGTHAVMLSRTTQFALNDRKDLIADHEGELGLIEYLKNKMEVVLEQITAEKIDLQLRFTQQKRLLQQEIQQKNDFIQKLQLRVRQLQGENQQIRYQYEQRLTLMSILKNQNGLLSKEFMREKEQMKQTIDALIAQNRQLKHTLIENQYYQQKVRNYCSPSRRKNYGLGEQRFHSYKDLRQFQRCKEENWVDACDETDQRLDKSMNGGESVNDDSLSKSSIVQMLKQRRAEFKQSRVTQIKGRNNTSQFVLQKFQTKTNLSRQRTAGGRFN